MVCCTKIFTKMERNMEHDLRYKNGKGHGVSIFYSTQGSKQSYYAYHGKDLKNKQQFHWMAKTQRYIDFLKRTGYLLYNN